MNRELEREDNMRRKKSTWEGALAMTAAALCMTAHVVSAYGQPVVIGPGGGTPIGGIQDWNRPQRLGPGVRWLRSAQTQKCIRARKGAPLDQDSCGPAPELRWMFQPVAAKSAHVIRNVATDTCLAVKKGAAVTDPPVLERCTYGARQRWQATGPADTPLSRLRALSTQACLEVSGNAVKMSAQCGAAATQRWVLTYMHREPKLLGWFRQTTTSSKFPNVPIIATKDDAYHLYYESDDDNIHGLVLQSDLRPVPSSAVILKPRLKEPTTPFTHKIKSVFPVVGGDSGSAIGHANVEVCHRGACNTVYHVAHIPGTGSSEVVLHGGDLSDAVMTPDGGWLVLGRNLGEPLGSAAKKNCTLMMLDSKSNVVLKRDLGLPDVSCERIARTEGGHVVAGSYYVAQTKEQGVALVKLDARLGTSWVRKLPSATWDRVEALRVTRSGDLLMAGFTSIPSTAESHTFVIRTTPQGVQKWRTDTSLGWPAFYGHKAMVRELRDGSIAVLVPHGDSTSGVTKNDGTKLIHLGAGGTQESGGIAVGGPELKVWDMVCHADDRCVVAGMLDGKQRQIGICELNL